MSEYDEIAKEAIATARSDVAILETLQISHISSSDDLYLIRNNEDLDLPLELGGEFFTFRGVGMQITLPKKSEQGLQDLSIAISNTKLEVSNYLKKALDYPNEPIEIKYRVYFDHDLSQPHNNPPLTLHLSNAKIDGDKVIGIATFADVLTKPFLDIIYDLNNFPAL